MCEFEFFLELKLMRNRLRQSFKMSSMGNLQDQVLSLKDAKARKQAKSDAKKQLVTTSLPSAKRQKTLLSTKQGYVAEFLRVEAN